VIERQLHRFIGPWARDQAAPASKYTAMHYTNNQRGLYVEVGAYVSPF
jgi:hypothetical protein